MRSNIHRRRDEGGFTIMESAASSFVLAIGVLGLVSTVVVQRQLEESTVRLWKSVGTATTAMEDLRANSLSRWSETALPSLRTWRRRSSQARSSSFVWTTTTLLVPSFLWRMSGRDFPTGFWCN